MRNWKLLVLVTCVIFGFGGLFSLPSAGARSAEAAKPRLDIVSIGYTAAPIAHPEQRSGAPKFSWTAAAIVRNPSSKVVLYLGYTFVLKGADGKTVAQSQPYTSRAWILPGEEIYLVANEEHGEGATAKPATVKLRFNGGELIPLVQLPDRNRVPVVLGTGDAGLVFTTGNVRFRTYERDGQRAAVVLGTATNIADRNLVGGAVDCVLMHGGKVVGGASGVLGVSPPRTPVAFDASIDVAEASPDEVRCRPDVGGVGIDVAAGSLAAQLASVPDKVGRATVFVVTFENTGGAVLENLTADVQLLDATGRPVAQSPVTSRPALVPGAQALAQTLELDETPDVPIARSIVRVAATSTATAVQFKRAYGYAPKALAVTKMKLHSDARNITGVVRNPGKRVLSVEVVCTVSRGSALVDVASTFVTIPSRGSAPVDAPLSLGGPGVGGQVRCTAVPDTIARATP